MAFRCRKTKSLKCLKCLKEAHSRSPLERPCAPQLSAPRRRTVLATCECAMGEIASQAAGAQKRPRPKGENPL